jgi:hypothetical protein
MGTHAIISTEIGKSYMAKKKQYRKDAQPGKWVLLGLGTFVIGAIIWGLIYAWYLRSTNVDPLFPFSLNSFRAFLLLIPYLVTFLWPVYYFTKGWFKTYYKLWPVEDRESQYGNICLICGGIDRDGNFYDHVLTVDGEKKTQAHYICDRCVNMAAHDRKRLISSFIMLSVIPASVWYILANAGFSKTLSFLALAFAFIISFWMFTAQISKKDFEKAGKELVAKYVVVKEKPAIYQRVQELQAAAAAEASASPAPLAESPPGQIPVYEPLPSMFSQPPAEQAQAAERPIKLTSTEEKAVVELPELASLGHAFKIHLFNVPDANTAEMLQKSLKVGKNDNRLEGYLTSRLLFLVDATRPIQNVDGNATRINLNNLWLLQDIWIMVAVDSEVHALERTASWRACEIDGKIVDLYRDSDKILALIEKYVKEEENLPPPSTPVMPSEPPSAAQAAPGKPLPKAPELPSEPYQEDPEKTARYKKPKI